jgi:hypothetical protein
MNQTLKNDNGDELPKENKNFNTLKVEKISDFEIEFQFSFEIGIYPFNWKFNLFKETDNYVKEILTKDLLFPFS